MTRNFNPWLHGYYLSPNGEFYETYDGEILQHSPETAEKPAEETFYSYPLKPDDVPQMSGPIFDGDIAYFVFSGNVYAYKVDLESMAFVFDSWFGDDEEEAEDTQ